MKLQKQFAYSYKGQKHYKNVVVIPDDVLLRLGWKKGQELESKIQEEKLILSIKRSEKP